MATITFGAVGSVQDWVVPGEVTSIDIIAMGSHGAVPTGGSPSGNGGKVTANGITVTPGETLKIYVGDTVGFGGGGTGAARGGGASDVRRGGIALSNRIIVAGGGGGSTVGSLGGDGGALTASAGGNTATATGGGGGTPSAGGSAGAPGGSAGTSAVGGNGGTSSGLVSGSGGGGGYFGGGGGGFGGTTTSTPASGGGGGSSYCATTATHALGFNTGQGSVQISWVTPPGSPGAWTRLADSTVTWYGVHMAAIGTKIYFVFFSGLYEYDTVNDTWTSRNSIPVLRKTPAIAAIGTKLYAVGSYDGNNSATNSLYEWDQATDVWTLKATIPTYYVACGAHAIGTKLYLIGGTTQDTANGSFVDAGMLREWDQATNFWSVKALMPSPRTSAATGAIGTKLYCAGGSQTAGGVATNPAKMYEWDQASNTWTTKSDLPAPRYINTGATLGTKFYALGGEDSSGILKYDLFEWDQATDTWYTSTPIPVARNSRGFLGLSGILYAGGGISGPIAAEPDPSNWLRSLVLAATQNIGLLAGSVEL